MTKPARSFLKWAGSKLRSIEFIKEALDEPVHRLVEPFVGSAVVSLNIEAHEYLLCDLNDDLINVFNTLKNEGEYFIKYCKMFFKDGNTQRQFYYNRSMFNDCEKGSLERAALFVYLNRHCFNGLCRYNVKSEFNVPYGKYASVHFPEYEMRMFLHKADKFLFKCQSFEKTFNECTELDVVYCDPPYLPLCKTSNFTDYTSAGFGLEEHKVLVNYAINCKCKKVLISNHWIPGVTEELYKDGNTARRKFVKRYISAYSSRPDVEEVLVIYE